MRALPPTAGVIGWPIAHSKSPRIHRFWLGKLGMDGDYARFPVRPDHLNAAVRALPALGLRGINVTVPHKESIIASLDRLAPSAQAIGAVNTVVVAGDTLVGHNTDIDGIAAPLAGRALAGRPIAVLGAGGAARAAVAFAARFGPVTVFNRSRARAEALFASLGVDGHIETLGAPLPPAALLINATNLGMVGQPPLLVDLAPLPADAVVFDCVYAPLETDLLRAARARGLATIDGLHMLIGQAAAAFELFYGAAAPRQFDGDLRALLLEG